MTGVLPQAPSCVIRWKWQGESISLPLSFPGTTNLFVTNMFVTVEAWHLR